MSGIGDRVVSSDQDELSVRNKACVIGRAVSRVL